jgi:DNA-binding PadR family transcriptional regulator
MTTRKDWLLVALSESTNGYLSPVQIQKALFLFRKGAEGHFDRSQFYDFSPYHYGPFSPDIYYDLEELEKRGLVQIGVSDSGKRKMYFITPEGRAAADRIQEENRRAYAYMGNVSRWVCRKEFTALLRYIYRRWPEFRRNSIFVDQT